MIRIGSTIGQFLAAFTILSGGAFIAQGNETDGSVERWGIFELSLKGPRDGNPFVDVTLSARFSQGDRIFEPSGFYDGDGVYRVRFMPDAVGEWTYVTQSNVPDLNGRRGRFDCVAPSPGNHGPVRVADTFRLAYADGTPHFSVGTTCYAWAHQGEALEEQTLATLRQAPFNKMRMCVFPKDYVYNKNEPPLYPYEGKPLKDWDYSRFNPAFFQRFEKRVGDLLALGIEADLILFHGYDRWGFAHMDAESDDRYLRYVVARLAAYRNVWWSMANEYDLMRDKTMADWDRFFQIVRDADPYDRLRSIHNCREFYDHTKPWVTHVSIQRSNFDQIDEWRALYKKPLIFDECRYEGDVPQGWGNLTAQQMTRYFWLGTMGGAYVGHGETYKHPEDILWWSKGGVLHGQSPARIAFLKELIEEAPYQEMLPIGGEGPVHGLVKPGACALIYFERDRSSGSNIIEETFGALGDDKYKLDGIDPWTMTIRPLGTGESGAFEFKPPYPDYAIRLTPYGPDEPKRPQAVAQAEPTEGIGPLKVAFKGSGAMHCRWEFGDGSVSTESNPTHVYEKPGNYRVWLTVTNGAGASAATWLSINVDRPSTAPIVRFGFADQDAPPLSENQGAVPKTPDGAYDFGKGGEPWKWITLGDQPLEDLEELQSFTVLGWLRPASLNIGSGGNRILFTLNHNRSGMDLVHLEDGRMRLAVNEWPDQIRNDSSSQQLKVGEWTFFAVTYDAMKPQKNVSWYFGHEGKEVQLDRTTNYSNGPTGSDSGRLAIGNFNETLRGAGLDRQFRGQIRGLEIYGSRIGGRGALSLEQINGQKDTGASGLDGS